MGQFCEGPTAEVPEGLPVGKAQIQLDETAEIDRKLSIDSPFQNLPAIVNAKLQELNYEPLQLESILKHPFIKLPNGVCYQGSIKGNEMNGIGRLAMPDGSYYQGGLAHSQLNGQGLLMNPQGDFYVGSFKDNKAEGKGMYVGDDFIYEGDFKNNLYSGYGKLTKKDQIFEGIFQKGKMKKGKLTKLKESSIYEGQFQGNIQNGFGRSTKDSTTYQGIFVNGSIQGQGKIIQPNGNYFICIFQRGKVVTTDKLSSTQTGDKTPQQRYWINKAINQTS